MINAKAVAGAVLVLMLLSVSCSAYYISGTVTDIDTDDALNNVRITYWKNNTLTTEEANTNAVGFYNLSSLTNGTYIVHGYRPDYLYNNSSSTPIAGASVPFVNLTLVNFRMPKTSTDVPNISEDASDAFIEALGGGNWTDNLFNFSGSMLSMSIPYTAIMGNLFFLFLFGAPFLMAWLRQANAAIPTVWGLVVGGTMLLFLPLEYRFIATLILVLAIVGGLWMVFKERF